VNICLVLGSAGRFLGPDQVGKPEIVRRDGPKPGFDAALPRRLKTWTSRHGCVQIDSNGCHPELNDPPRVRQIRNRVPQIATSEEVEERSQCPAGVSRGGIQQDIKVLCGARAGVEGDRVGADQQIPHPMVV
jgi:hypothetical protein